jgi:hypothetical protein
MASKKKKKSSKKKSAKKKAKPATVAKGRPKRKCTVCRKPGHNARSHGAGAKNPA